jgi:ABC-type proline/glycine betaine transport system permease subunit
VFYSAIGIVLALGIAVVAWRSSASRGGYYDREIYGMSRATHVRYAVISLAFAGFFIAAYAFGLRSAGIVALALYALLAVFYLTSFLRGAAESDE